ncbi:MAG: helix-turn-helix transcriptional regulator [Clostridia bacterium]|nr:helix-turn-helix transcriptional regulator [Clostridia bacterium]
MDILAKNLKQLRLEKHLSQKDISNALNIAVSTYANWEQGRRDPSLDDLVKITNYLEVSSDFLLGIDEYY